MINRIADGLQSLATRLGTSTDKGATASYSLSVLNDEQLDAAFRCSWIARKIVVVPALDAVRKWREWTDESENAALVEALEDIFRVKSKVLEAKWKARLYGGAAILIGVGNDDLSEPLDPRRVRRGDLQFLTVLTRRDLLAGEVELDPRQSRHGMPRDYQITTNSGEALRVHPSRLVEFRGEPLPSQYSGHSVQFGWGDSVLQATYEAARNLDATMANIAGLVYDAKTDIIHIPGLSEGITDPQYELDLISRFSAFRLLKGNQGVGLLDEKETYESKSYTFSGLPDIADRFMQVAAGAADIPMTRLMGQSPGGLNSTGEGDLANYYDRIQAMQTLEMEPAMTVLDEVLARSAIGDYPSDLTYDWRPLRQMTEAQNSEIRSRNAETIAKLAGAALYDPADVAATGAQMFRETGIDSLGNDAAGFEGDDE